MNFNLNIVDDILNSEIINSKEFKEFCSDLDQISVINDYELYAEAVVDPKSKFKNNAGRIIKNTKDTISIANGTYNNITDMGGMIYKGTWDVTFSAIKLISRIAGFIVVKIMTLPEYIIKIMNTIGDIPENIKNKIKGNIKLYITVNDLKMLYNDTLMEQLVLFINYSDQLVRGDFWSNSKNIRAYNKKGEEVEGRYAKKYAPVKDNDMNTIRRMGSIYKRLKLIKFNETVIKMDNPENIETYFGKKNKTKFRELDGTIHESTYYEALAQLMKDLRAQKGKLENIRNEIGEKYSRTQLNEQFSKMNANDQRSVTDIIQQISSIIAIVGNIVKYVITDMNTIEKTAQKLIKRGDERVKKIDKISVEENSKKKHTDTSDAFNPI